MRPPALVISLVIGISAVASLSLSLACASGGTRSVLVTGGPRVGLELAPAFVRNPHQYEVVVVIGLLRRPDVAECGLLLGGERVSPRAFSTSTYVMEPGRNLAVEGTVGDGSCGVIMVTVGGTRRALAWRSDDLPLAYVPASGDAEDNGRIEVGAFAVTSIPSQMTEVPID